MATIIISERIIQTRYIGCLETEYGRFAPQTRPISFAICTQLWKMKELLKTQVKKERFWETDEDFLLEIGTCIGELMFAKLQVMTERA